MKKGNKSGLLGCGSIVLIILVVGIALSIKDVNNENKIKALIDRTEEYGSMTGVVDTQAAANPMKAYIIQNREKVGSKGEKYEYSPLCFTIPDEMLAKTPEEMNTLVQLTRHTDATGKYTTGKIAYSRIIDMTVIDLASGKVIMTETFTGSPPTVLVGSQKPYGDWPDSEVVDLLMNMAGGYIKTPAPTY